MLTRISWFLSQVFNRTRIINSEPLNKVSLIFIILIDVFILVNVFSGLNDISQWYLNPSEVYPCYSEWKDYQAQTKSDKNYEIIQRAITQVNQSLPTQQIYQHGVNRLGKVSETCTKFAELRDSIKTSKNLQAKTNIENKQTAVSIIERENRDIRDRYDSTLLEKIAGQPRRQSINPIAAEKAKQQLERNNRKISILNQEIFRLKGELINQPENTSFINFLQNNASYQEVNKGYDQALFWYPSIQLFFQSLFLLPLILVASTIHSFSQRRGYGLVSLISWHLLIILLIPLIFKVFEFLQVNVIFQFIFNIISAIFSGLLFLVNYVYILLIPLIGFGIIKFFQRVVFNVKVQASGRVQKSRCIQCARRIRPQEAYCPHCSYYQYVECQNCHKLTYKHLPYCKQCGVAQNLADL